VQAAACTVRIEAAEKHKVRALPLAVSVTRPSSIPFDPGRRSRPA